MHVAAGMGKCMTGRSSRLLDETWSKYTWRVDCAGEHHDEDGDSDRDRRRHPGHADWEDVAKNAADNDRVKLAACTTCMACR